jgi:soluble lytic murein transglycosylase-like protein
VMGQVAREFGFNEASLAELCDPAKGIELGCKILAKRLARSKDDVSAALQAWNGGAIMNYATQVMTRTRNYSSKPVV